MIRGFNGRQGGGVSQHYTQSDHNTETNNIWRPRSVAILRPRGLQENLVREERAAMESTSVLGCSGGFWKGSVLVQRRKATESSVSFFLATRRLRALRGAVTLSPLVAMEIKCQSRNGAALCIRFYSHLCRRSISLHIQSERTTSNKHKHV